jgi:hypothetical protein
MLERIKNLMKFILVSIEQSLLSNKLIDDQSPVPELSCYKSLMVEVN